MAGVDLRTVAELLLHQTLQTIVRDSLVASEHPAAAVAWLEGRGNQRDTKSDTG